MATKKSTVPARVSKPKASVVKVPAFSQYFGLDDQARHLKGKQCRDLYVESVEEFFANLNYNLYISGQPGVGKTYTVERIAKNYPNVYLLVLKGNMTPWSFIKTMAVNLFVLPKNMRLVVFIDDMNSMFKSNSEFLDMFKIAMDRKSGDRLEYNTSLGSQYSQAEDPEKAAIDYWKQQCPTRTGFVIPFNKRVNFIFTMNTPLPSQRDLASLEEGSDKWIKLNNRAAIRSRVQYEDLNMDQDTYWGWIADVVWNETTTMCAGATSEQRFEMLSYLWDNWNTISETSLRLVEEKMWPIMQKYPSRPAYRARWAKL